MFKSKVLMLLLTIIVLFGIFVLGIYFFQEKLIFYPERLPGHYHYDFDSHFEELYFEVEEGVRINALHFKSDQPKGVIFYSHGNAGSLRTWGNIADIFLAHGYDVLMYDYRGYGKSGGSITEQNLYSDAEMIYSELLKMYDESQIIVYGRSIGTGIAAKISEKNNPQQLFLESPYYNFQDLVKNILPFIPTSFIRFKFRNDQMLKKVTCPIIVLHGTADEVIYFGSSIKLQRLLKDKVKLIPIEGGHHNDLASFDAYHHELIKALN